MIYREHGGKGVDFLRQNKMVDENKIYLNTQSELSMKGAGYYSNKTIGAKIAIDSLQHLITNAVSNMTESNFLRFADFGSADGGTSQELWYNLIKSIRARGDKRPIEIIYTDLASNDFSTLFKTMQGMGCLLYTSPSPRDS